MKFYLGAHQPHWLGRATVPLFVSHRRLADRKSLPVALCDWALDSGAFTEISTYGKWVTTADQYVEAVARYEEEIGRMDWAAPMDWMCEPEMIAKTGLSVEEHQARTVENFLELRDRGPFIPVLQGWSLSDYERHMGMYADAGVDLTGFHTVGLGSVCRREATDEVAALVRMVSDAGISPHGFGMKTAGIYRCGVRLRSADSMAWSFAARYRPPLPGHSHKSCANCLEFALRWREQIVGAGMAQELPLGVAA